jgi:hypothetical protein
MRRALLVMLAVAGWATPAPGQLPYPAAYAAVVYRPGFGYGFYYRSLWVSPLLPYPGYGPGWGPGYGNPFFLPQPPVVVVPPPVVVVGGAAPARDDDLPRGAKPGDFVVIRPAGKAPEGKVVPELDKIVKPRPPEPPAADPFAPPVLAPMEKPEADPAAEAARQARLARAAFAAEEYAAAADHLTRAARAKPDDPLTHFLLAQVRFASGRYADAVAAIEAGLRLAPHWPVNEFRPRELYGPHPDRFDTHLAALRKAAAANPGDAGLAFLLGYQLWFGGDRPAAVEQFKKAPKAAGPFLRAAEDR